MTKHLCFVCQEQSVFGHNIFIFFCRSRTGSHLDVYCAWHKGYSATPTFTCHLLLQSEFSGGLLASCRGMLEAIVSSFENSCPGVATCSLQFLISFN